MDTVELPHRVANAVLRTSRVTLIRAVPDGVYEHMSLRERGADLARVSSSTLATTLPSLVAAYRAALEERTRERVPLDMYKKAA